jgi:hypothetical protein
MDWVTSTLHTTSEHGVSSITTADEHNSAASSWLNWGHRRFKWTLPFGRKTKSGFCACAITFQTQSTAVIYVFREMLLTLMADKYRDVNVSGTASNIVTTLSTLWIPVSDANIS